MMSHQWWGLCGVFLASAFWTLVLAFLACIVAEVTGGEVALKRIMKVGIALVSTFAALAFTCAIGGVMTSPPPQEVVR